MKDPGRPWGLFLAAVVFLIVIVTFLVASFERPRVLSYAPSSDAGRPAAGAFVTDTVTLDARDGSVWVYFDLERGSIVDGRVDPEWDLAIQRFHVVTNGGPGYPGEAGAIALTTSWDSVVTAPESGYETTRGGLTEGPANPALERWYKYSFFSHTLMPKPETYVIQTASSRFAKVEVISYYCPEAEPGCFTFRYAYQGDGSRRLVP